MINRYKKIFDWPDSLLNCRLSVGDKPLVCFDIESYKNFSLVVTIGPAGIRAARSDRGDFEAAVRRLFSQEDAYFVGFNSAAFDVPFIEHAGNNDAANFDYAQRLISGAEDVFKNYRLWKRVPCIDLLDLRGPAEKVGLKGLAARSDAKIIQELPYSIDTALTEEQINDVVGYCINDVVETNRFLHSKIGELQLRHSLYGRYLIGTKANYPKFLSSKGAAVAETILTTLLGVSSNILDTEHDIKEAPGKDLLPAVRFKTKELQDHYKGIYDNRLLLRSDKVD